jgi:hypothetical protein
MSDIKGPIDFSVSPTASSSGESSAIAAKSSLKATLEIIED